MRDINSIENAGSDATAKPTSTKVADTRPSDVLNAANAILDNVNSIGNGFSRNPAAEAAAIASGTATKAEIEARGGINASGYYGDSWNPKTSLTDAEYAAAKAKGGGSAINDAIAAKVAANAPKSDSKQLSESFAAGRSLASDTFINTFGLIFGKTEAALPYVKKLYGLVSGFYTTGSTIDESLNLALRQARDEKSIPEFTKRFSGLFALDDKFKAGEAITVPTIAEFMATEAKMGEVLSAAGLGELATQDFLGGVIGQNKSVLEVSNLINDVFNTIDNAPQAVKNTLTTYFPGVDRTAVAKAMLTGTAGAQELSNKVKGIQVMAAGTQQGINVSLTQAQDIANQGYDYNQALTGFGQVKNLDRANTLAQLTGSEFTQAQAQQAVFGKSIEQQNTLDSIKAQEEARFRGSSGTTKGAFSTGYLNKQSSAGSF
jgi:hypothetical protein